MPGRARAHPAVAIFRLFLVIVCPKPAMVRDSEQGGGEGSVPAVALCVDVSVG